MLGRRTYTQWQRNDSHDGKPSAKLGLVPPSSKRSKNNDGEDSSDEEDAALFEKDDVQTPARAFEKQVSSTQARREDQFA